MTDLPNLFVSVSGGETSAFMAWLIKNHYSHLFNKIIYGFANTSEEFEQTLVFNKKIEEFFQIPITWLEAVQNHDERKSPDYRIVDFKTAKRDGSVYEDAIKKYGIPNAAFSHCTRSLKTVILEKYAKEMLGENYMTAIGIRIDEVDRMSVSADKKRLIYPLINFKPMTKSQINKWWSEQPFRLELKGYQGNCKWCWKKTKRKHMTLIRENPDIFEFPKRMEEKYSLIGPEFIKDPTKKKGRVFFRENKSTNDLFSEFETVKDTFIPFEDENQKFDNYLDIPGSCNESCEIYSEEQDEIKLGDLI